MFLGRGGGGEKKRFMGLGWKKGRGQVGFEGMGMDMGRYRDTEEAHVGWVFGSEFFKHLERAPVWSLIQSLSATISNPLPISHPVSTRPFFFSFFFYRLE